MDRIFTLYGIQNKKTGKLISASNSTSKKFWQRRDICAEAIRKHRKFQKEDLEMVEIFCVSMPADTIDEERLNLARKLLEMFQE